MNITLTEFNNMCLTEIIEDLHRLKRDIDNDKMQTMSMHGVQIKEIPYYRDIIRKHESKRLEKAFDQEKVDKIMAEAAKEWQQTQ